MEKTSLALISTKGGFMNEKAVQALPLFLPCCTPRGKAARIRNTGWETHHWLLPSGMRNWGSFRMYMTIYIVIVYIIKDLLGPQ